MKKILLILLTTITFTAFATESDSTAVTQKPKHWTVKNDMMLTFEQQQTKNWSAGGYSSVTFGGLFKGFYNYKYDKHKVDNTVEVAYGRTRQDICGKGIWDKENEWIKSEDRIEINSIYGYQAVGFWNYSSLINIKSQFDNGYSKDDRENPISAGLSPVVMTTSVGLEYKKSYFSTLFSCLTGKTTYCLDKRRSIHEAVFGKDDWDRTWKLSLGSYIKVFYQRDVMKNINILAKLDLFYDYKKPLIDTDITTEIFVSMKISKYLNTFISIQAAIDKDFSTAIQYKERFGISIPINF